MKFSVILTTVQSALATWAATYSGTAEVAGDASHAFSILAAKPGGVRAVVWIAGEKKRGEHEEASMVDDSLQVIINRGSSLTVRPGDTHVSALGGKFPLIDLVEEARDVIRGLSLPADETEVTLDYQGFAFLADETGPLNAYQLTFSIGNLLGAPSATPMAGALVGKGLHAGMGQVLGLEDDTVALIPAGAEIYDEMNGYTNGIFTAPVAGTYICEVAYLADFSDGAFEWGLGLSGNGGGYSDVSDSLRFKKNITAIRLPAGGTVAPYIAHETGVPRNFGSPSIEATSISFFKVHRIT